MQKKKIGGDAGLERKKQIFHSDDAGTSSDRTSQGEKRERRGKEEKERTLIRGGPREALLGTKKESANRNTKKKKKTKGLWEQGEKNRYRATGSLARKMTGITPMIKNDPDRGWSNRSTVNPFC